MLQLITTALAAFTAVMALRLILPFALPGRLMPILVAAVAYGLDLVPGRYQVFVQAAACAGLAAIIHRIAVGEEPEPWSVRRMAARIAIPHRPRHRRKQPEPASRIGRRIPTL